MSDYVPETIVIEILSRLPVKDLMRFQCVCKHWRILIYDGHFLSMHLKNFTLSKRNFNFPQNLLLMRIKFGVPIAPLLTSHDNFIHLPLPPSITNNPLFASSDVLGPYHGIYCLYNRYDDIVLWNPSLRQETIVPKSLTCLVGLPDQGKRHSKVGFGFDSRNKTYKVLHILCHFDDCDRASWTTRFNVFDLVTKTWRTIEVVETRSFCFHGTGCNVGNKYFCWLANVQHHSLSHRPSSEEIFSFDLCDEVHKTIPLPREVTEMRPKVKYARDVFTFNQSIAVAVYSRMLIQPKHIDIWVISEFGEKESWSKLFSLHNPNLRLEKPLGFWLNEELFIKTSSGAGLLSYDHQTQKFKSPGFVLPCSVQILFYEESLVKVT